MELHELHEPSLASKLSCPSANVNFSKVLEDTETENFHSLCHFLYRFVFTQSLFLMSKVTVSMHI